MRFPQVQTRLGRPNPPVASKAIRLHLFAAPGTIRGEPSLRVKNSALLPSVPGTSRAAHSQPIRTGWIDAWCQAAFASFLHPMQRGRLDVLLPDRSRMSFGGTLPGPEAFLAVHDPRFFRRCVASGDIGFGESFQAGEWDSDDLSAVIAWFCANADNAPTLAGSSNRPLSLRLFSSANRLRHLFNRNTRIGSRRNIHAHYDIGNAFYSLWLDPTLTYSAALFESPDHALEAAQVAKYDRLCRQLRLKPGLDVLEIGSGWGGFTRHAVQNYGCRVTTVTLSTEQRDHALALLQREGIADRADVLLLDYRDIPSLGKSFDRIASIEMLEAVGDAFLEAYFSVVHRVLRPGGVFGAQFITCPDSRYDQMRRGVDWIQKHVFPGSLLLSLNRVNQAIARTGNMHLHDLRDFGPDYARTLRIWRERFNARLDEVRALGFDTWFVRTWNYYLAYCEAAFAHRSISVVQGIWTPPNNGSL